MLQPLHYLKNTAELFAPFAHEPWALFLDSCAHKINKGRYDIIALRPHTKIISKNGVTTIETQGEKTTLTFDNPLNILRSYVQKIPSNKSHLPFTGGALGYFSYDLGRTLEVLPQTAHNDLDIPQMCIGIYQKVIIVDHLQKKTWYNDCTEETFEDLMDSVPLLAANTPFKLAAPFKSNMTKAHYHKAFNAVKQHILAGDCYQINLSQRFSAKYTGSAWHAYQTLRDANPSPFSAFLNFPEHCVLSFSPERFIQNNHGQLLTQPIKGTSPRRTDPGQDKASYQKLTQSSKDKAENLMIVDLLRNDFGKVCEYGSIHVPELFRIESFKNVHHMISDVIGNLAGNYDNLDVLKACFPGGSITGAPKIRAQQIIESLEPQRRQIYCGSIGYLDNHVMDTNICIRTLYTYKHSIYCSAGGAIVADSTIESEYQECFDKVNVFLQTLSLSL